MKFRREQLPWAMAASRALLGPALIAGEKCGWNGMTLAWMVVTALLSDIFDGVLARHWRCDTPGVRLFDSMADTVFYGSAAIAVWIGQPALLRENAGLLATLLALEGVSFGLNFAKFGKPASYHSYLAKAWGLTLATAVVAAFAFQQGSPLLPVALALGIICNLEGLAMSLALPMWRKDVKTLNAAWELRQQMVGVRRSARQAFPA
jgi:CDP-diacylglycerol--glycerol-3-phosphate 3-phosphatidyltransferase